MRRFRPRVRGYTRWERARGVRRARCARRSGVRSDQQRGLLQQDGRATRRRAVQVPGKRRAGGRCGDERSRTDDGVDRRCVTLRVRASRLCGGRLWGGPGDSIAAALRFHGGRGVATGGRLRGGTAAGGTQQSVELTAQQVPPRRHQHQQKQRAQGCRLLQSRESPGAHPASSVDSERPPVKQGAPTRVVGRFCPTWVGPVRGR